MTPYPYLYSVHAIFLSNFYVGIFILRVSILINDNKAEVEALQSQIDELLKQKRTLESDLSDIKLTSKLTANRLDSLQKEYDQHMSRCDAELVKINAENMKLQGTNETLEKNVSLLEAKLKGF